MRNVQIYVGIIAIVGTMLGAGFAVPAQAADAESELNWITDYHTATEQAKQEQKMLLILFQNRGFNAVPDPYEVKYLPAQADKLKNYVVAKLPTSATIKIDGQEKRVLEHGAFANMKGSAGIAVIDFEHKGKPYYGYVVSEFPFAGGKYYNFRPEHVPVVVALPEGTISQRTMIYAVRIHPEAPASTQGAHHPILSEEACSHCGTQANMNVQGHHQWDSRFHRIMGRLFGHGTPTAGYPTEVCAESWPNQDLLDSCVDCVASWRQSSGHWSAVKTYHASYGYDIRRGSNGIWYATGIFAN